MIEVTSKTPQLAKAGDPETIPERYRVMEVKYDGHRILAQVDSSRNVHLYARTGVEKSGHTPNITEALAGLPPSTLLDGEIVQLNDGGDDWSSVQSVLGSSSVVTRELTYVVFDVLEFDGHDVRGLTLADRRVVLERIFAGLIDGGDVILAQWLPYEPEAVEAIIAKGWEGVIVKDTRARYASGKRGHGWLKIKATATEDVVIMGATDGKGQFQGQVGALVFGQHFAGRLTECGQCSGMDFAERALFTRMRDAGTLAGTVIEVQHMGKMPSGGWRHPQFRRVRTDKQAHECMA